MVLIDDVVVAFGAAVATASLVVLLALLSRYRALVKDANNSSNLNKNLWDAMNGRLQTQDTRIVDLMAKVEVFSVRNRSNLPTATRPQQPQRDVTQQTSRVAAPAPQASQVQSQPFQPLAQSADATSDGTQTRILRALLEGPKTPNQIRDVIGVSREHTGRLMKSLFQRGLVVRNDRNKPYVYELSEAGRRYLGAV